MKLLCKLVGHRLQEQQVWGQVHERDADDVIKGSWLKLRSRCMRCHAMVPLDFYLTDAAARRSLGDDE